MKRRQFVGCGAMVSLLGMGAPALSHVPQLPKYDIPEDFLPREVRIKPGFSPYELRLDPGQFALYWTLPEGRAIRYTVGIGRPGLYEAGEFYVGAKKEWPSWTPTPDMIRREPKRYAKFADGVPGGLNNPLGAGALPLSAGAG